MATVAKVGVPLSGGTASFQTALPAVDNTSVNAIYPDDSTLNASTSTGLPNRG
jgi:hypothetical protein